QVLDESLILFVAGHETSANALTWTLYLLTQHPHYLEAIRNEHRGGDLSFTGLMQRTMTRQVIEESMRLYPPAWIIDRLPNEDDGVLGFSYPKDTFLIQFIYGVHHDPELWPDPSRFDPERFSETAKRTHVPYSYLPFGGGPRLCIGNQFAMLEMILVLGYIARHFDLRSITMRPEIQPMVTLRPRGALWMKVTPKYA
ncbi:MAG: cytochrome P450, partial [Saprospiraceae bacterium]|nr:cytochrome P450 [Saprospiraceae bacterium]